MTRSRHAALRISSGVTALAALAARCFLPSAEEDAQPARGQRRRDRVRKKKDGRHVHVHVHTSESNDGLQKIKKIKTPATSLLIDSHSSFNFVSKYVDDDQQVNRKQKNTFRPLEPPEGRD